MSILLPVKIMEILTNSGYNSYFISEYDLAEIISIYNKFQLCTPKNLIDLISVFGDRTIFYENNSIPNRKYPYEINFNPRNFLGKSTKTNILDWQFTIAEYEKNLSVNKLVPFAIMPSGPMTYYIDDKENIYGIIDDLCLIYKGNNLWDSLIKLFNGNSQQA